MSLEEIIDQRVERRVTELFAKMKAEFVEEYIPEEQMTAKAAAKQLNMCIITFNKFVEQDLIQPIGNITPPKYSRKSILKFNETPKKLRNQLPRRS